MDILQRIIVDSGLTEAQFWRTYHDTKSGLTYYSKADRSRGKQRTYNIANKSLRRIHEQIKIFLNYQSISTHSHCRRGRGARTNAAMHVRKEVVVSIDVKDCFPSITTHQIFNVFKSVGADDRSAQVLSVMTTVNGRLPQGFSTSPVLQNLLFRPIDKRVGVLAKKSDADYGRHVDDMTLSGPRSTSRLSGTVKAILRDYGLTLNAKKFGLKGIRFAHQCQEVNGVKVNIKMGPPRKHIKRCQSAIDRYDHALRAGADAVPLLACALGRIRYVKSLCKKTGNRQLKRLHQLQNSTHASRRRIFRSSLA